jgi:hypothetical protein
MFSPSAAVIFLWQDITMNTIAGSHVLTPALWKTLKPKINQETPSIEPLLLLTQGVFHDSDIRGYVKLRLIHEVLTLEALLNVYIEGAQEPLSARISIADARFYGSTSDIIHQNGAFYSVIFKVISYYEGVPAPEIYVWEIPPVIAPEAIESDISLFLSKGMTFYVSSSEEDIVMDRTFRVALDHRVSVSIRTVEGRSYSTTVAASEVARYAMPGDYYVESGSDELCIIYGVTTEPHLPLIPKIKYTPIPINLRPGRDLE